jgi:hypothetical protein
MIDFSIDPDFQQRLDWMDAFVRDKCETMDLLWPDQGACYDTKNDAARRHLKPLQDQVKAQGRMWLCGDILMQDDVRQNPRRLRRGGSPQASRRGPTLRLAPSLRGGTPPSGLRPDTSPFRGGF